MSDDRTLKERFLVRAESLSEYPEVFRCPNVTLLICDAVACGVRAEAEIFQAAYGDPSGRKYWDARLSEAIPVVSLANILSVHRAEGVQQLEYGKFATLCAFRDAAEASERWFVGDTTTLLAVKDFSDDVGGLDKVKVDPHAAVQWLLSKPMREHLVPESLRRHLNFVSPRENSTSSQARPAMIGSNTYAPSDGVVEKRLRGPKPNKREQVKEAMRRDIKDGRHTVASLHAILEKNLAAAYDVSRDTARKARTEILSEFAENLIRDK